MNQPCDHAYSSKYRMTTTKDRKAVLRHRLVYCETHGLQLRDIEGVVIRHTCDNPACCEPTHLVPGTQSDNMRDMVERGRHVKPNQRGEAHSQVKLTDAQVAEIRQRYKRRCPVNGGQVLAAEYGVSASAISMIVNGRMRHEQC